MVKKTRFQKIFSVKVTNLTLLLIYLPMGILFFEFILHVGDADQLGRSFAWQNLIYFFFMLSFFLLMGLGDIEKVTMKELGGSLKLLIYMGILAFINLMLTFAIQVYIVPQKWTLVEAEVYIFYFNTALSEEILFRAVGISLFRRIFSTMFDPRKSKLIIDVNSVFVTAFIFSLSHWFVYAENIGMMLSTFLGGLSLGFFYILSDNILVTMGAHAFNNLVTVYYNNPYAQVL